MSEPPSQSPWSVPPGEQPPGAPPQYAPPPGGAPVPTPPFVVPAQSLGYVMPEYRGRPGLITAIGIVSIVIASLSIISSLFTVLQSAGYYMMSMMSSSVAAAQSRAAAANTAQSRVMYSTQQTVGAPTRAQGLNTAERATALAALTARQPLMPTRKRHLDAILAEAGKDMAVDRVTESGTMEAMRSGEMPPDFFVTPTGRLEVFNDRAVFYPRNNTPTVRVSAPPPGAEGESAQPVGELIEEPAAGGVIVHDLSVSVTPLPGSATNPTTAPATMPGAALTAAEVQSIVQQAQSLTANGLNPAQVTTLTNVLSAPGQQLVQPGDAEGAVVTAYAPAGGQAVVQFSDGGSVNIGPQGNVVAMSSSVVMPTFNFRPMTLGLMAGSAIASLGLAVYLLVCGILTLRQSPRGRGLHFVYALIKIPLAVTAGFAAAGVMRDFMSSMGGAMPPTTGFSLFTGLTPVVLGCAYPIALLIVLNVKSVRDYYRAPEDGGPPGAFAAG